MPMPIDDISGPRLDVMPHIGPQNADSSSRFLPIGAEEEAAPGANFASDMASMLHDVSELQRDSAKMTEALVRGDPVDLHQVIIRQEEAHIAFALLLETRNKVLEAYQEIMRMSG